MLPNRIFRTTHAVILDILNYFRGNYKNDYTTIHPWNYLKDRIMRKLRNLRSNADLFGMPDPSEDYAYFPLQYEPEVGLLLYAPFYTNQLNLIRQIAQSLPVHFKLYVKEHPQMVSFRPRSFYLELRKIPNVKLMSPAVGGFRILQNAKLVTVITGTTGWEATLLKKPVISFANIFYNDLSFVKRSYNIEQLPLLVNEQLENFHYDENELVRFIAAILENSCEIDLVRLWTQETDRAKQKDGLTTLADLIAKKIGLAKI